MPSTTRLLPGSLARFEPPSLCLSTKVWSSLSVPQHSRLLLASSPLTLFLDCSSVAPPVVGSFSGSPSPRSLPWPPFLPAPSVIPFYQFVCFWYNIHQQVPCGGHGLWSFSFVSLTHGREPGHWVGTWCTESACSFYTVVCTLKAEMCWLDLRHPLGFLCFWFIPGRVDLLSWINHSTDKAEVLETTWPQIPTQGELHLLVEPRCVSEFTHILHWLVVKMHRPLVASGSTVNWSVRRVTAPEHISLDVALQSLVR